MMISATAMFLKLAFILFLLFVFIFTDLFVSVLIKCGLMFLFSIIANLNRIHHF